MTYVNDRIAKETGADAFVARHPNPRRSVVARIARCAAEFPDRPAIVDGAATVSYGTLESRSNQLAHHLVKAGARAESTAVLQFDRSADFIIAALAVMKAGGAYVPMDSAIPADRLAFVMADSGAQFLLTHRGKWCGRDAGQCKMTEIDGNAAASIADQPTTAPAVDFSIDQLAYLVYTSGSTGRPKGVEITHGNLNCLIDWHQNAFGLTPADRASHVAGLGFDAAGWEIWPTLAAGAALHIADETTRRSPEELQNWLIEQQITICFAPTVLAEQLLRATWPKNTALRWLLVGGDSLHRRPTIHLPFAVQNCYGPSECTVVSTSGRVAPEGSDTPSIGRAIAHTIAVILDEHLRPVAAGEAGELCLGGPHVGRGYRNHPELTARQFVMHDPGDGTEPIRIYRTGDRARLLENGEIAFLGRLDDQVKIRGYRIEPGEISAWLNKLPAIKESAVVARDCGNGLELVAYVSPNGTALPDIAELRAYLAAKLPDYMVPAQFVSLPAMPTTVNGKLDRAALPAPTASNTIQPRANAQPPTRDAESELERRLTAIISALLGRPSVNGTDNFFMLGGHSMLGVQLAAKIRDTFGVKLTLRQLFSAPSVNALCAEIRRLSAANPAVFKRH